MAFGGGGYHELYDLFFVCYIKLYCDSMSYMIGVISCYFLFH